MTDPNQTNVSLTNESLTYLKESGRWGTFLAIVGFIFAGLFICGGLFAGTFLSAMGGGDDPAMGGITTVLVGGVYIVFGGVYLIPTFYLYRFSQEIKNALGRNSTEAMTAALRNLKSLLKFLGVFTAIYFVVVVLGILVMGATGLFM